MVHKKTIEAILTFLFLINRVLLGAMPLVRATNKNIKKAAQIIKNGGIVAFPTETVYGLGANAFDAQAVKKIFKAKGRPSDNPLIVHVADIKILWQIAKREVRLEGLVAELVKAFWPGPLTLVLKKKKVIPKEVSAGLNTVAVRMPAHKVALALIRKARSPIAAPSANLSGKPSPTEARHVQHDLGDKVDLILDGGKTEIGLESTVLDLTVSPPTILRQGAVTLEMLRRIISNVQIIKHKKNIKAKSPGMRYRHYAPEAKLYFSKGLGKSMANYINAFLKKHLKKKVGILSTKEFKNLYKGGKVISIGSRKNLSQCAKNLFTALRKFDSLKVDVIISERFPESGVGRAIMDRLRRAAQYSH